MYRASADFSPGRDILRSMKPRAVILTLVQVAIAVALESWLIRATLQKAKAANVDPWSMIGAGAILPLFAAFAIFGFVQLVVTWRWSVLLRVQGVRLPFLQLLRLTLIGQFFNLALPGAVTGDIVKMAYIAKAAPEKKAECILTIVIDRIFGVLGLFVLATIFVLLHLSFLRGLDTADHDQMMVKMAAFTVGFGSVGGILFVLAVEFHKKLLALPLMRTVVPAVAKRLPAKVCDVVTRLVCALDLCRGHRRAVASALGLSLVVHSSLAVMLLLIGRALGEGTVLAGGYFLTTQVANAVAAIPLTPGGVGLRDNCVSYFLKALDATPAATAGFIPVLFTLLMAAWGIGGGVLFMLRSRKSAKAD